MAKGDRRAVLDAGLDAILPKPSSPGEGVDILSAVIAKDRQISGRGGDPVPSSSTTNRTTDLPETQLTDNTTDHTTYHTTGSREAEAKHPGGINGKKAATRSESRLQSTGSPFQETVPQTRLEPPATHQNIDSNRQYSGSTVVQPTILPAILPTALSSTAYDPVRDAMLGALALPIVDVPKPQYRVTSMKLHPKIWDKLDLASRITNKDKQDLVTEALLDLFGKILNAESNGGEN